MNWKYLFTSFDGRISRQPFWAGMLVLTAVSVAGEALSAALGSNPSLPGSLSNFIDVLLIFPLAAVTAKRWHDRGKTGWLIFLYLIPVIGWIWLLVECGFLRGTPGPNQFGPDPLGAVPATAPQTP